MIYRDVTREQLTRIIVEAVKQELKRGQTRSGEGYLVPAGISVRHIHLERKHVNQLFGFGHQLTVKSGLSQPGQFACEETLDLEGPKGTIQHVRVLGPERDRSQVEIAMTDARILGITPPVRASGDLYGTPGILLRGPEGAVRLEQGVIAADRHIHMTPEDAAWFGVTDKELVQVEIGGEKPGVMGNVRIRVSENYALDFHIDTDDGNAFLLKQGQLVKVLRP